jgi:hypothetical protein
MGKSHRTALKAHARQLSFQMLKTQRLHKTSSLVGLHAKGAKVYAFQ